MATFYVLPPRLTVSRRFGDYLQNWFPGLPAGDDLADDIVAIAMKRSAAYVVYADELADDADLEYALATEFGAEAGDRIVDLRTGPVRADGMRVRIAGHSPLRRSA